jgi:hypothetical protein
MLYLLNINVLIKIMKMYCKRYCKRYCKKEIIYIYKDRKELLIKRLHLLNIKVFL